MFGCTCHTTVLSYNPGLRSTFEHHGQAQKNGTVSDSDCQAGATTNARRPSTTRNCICCRRQCYVPDHDDFPLPQHRLSREVVHALRPFHPFHWRPPTGKAGFRRHSRWADIRCAPVDVTAKIDALPEECQQIARTAFHYLMTYCETSAYGDFVRAETVNRPGCCQQGSS